MEILAVVLGLGLTLAIFSYLLGDNPLYRVAVHLLVGVSAAYAGVIAVREVIVPALLNAADAPQVTTAVLWLFPLFLALLLLIRTLSQLAWVGQSAVAALVGVGAAIALAGTITGTLIPQAFVTGGSGALLGLVTALLTVVVLFYFYFTTGAGEGRPAPPRRFLRYGGRFILTITFGALFASVLSTSLTLLTERVDFLFRLLGL